MLTRRMLPAVSGVLVSLLPALGCNDAPFAPDDPAATLGQVQEWRGIALIRSTAFHDQDLVAEIVAESRAFNAARDTLPCVWWRQASVGQRETNCSWQVVQLHADDVRLDTYLADSTTVAAVLPRIPKSWDLTLRVNGFSVSLGTVRTYGLSDAHDGPPIAGTMIDWPGTGSGRLLARTGSNEPDNTAILRNLDLRTGNYLDFDLGQPEGEQFAPGFTWDPGVIWFPTRQPEVHYWRLSPTLAPVDTLLMPCGTRFRFAVAVSPTECVAMDKRYAAFVTDSTQAFPCCDPGDPSYTGEPSRIKHSVTARRWVSLSIGNKVWDFAGNVPYRIQEFPWFSAAAFSAGGDSLFVAGHPVNHPPSPDTLFIRKLLLVDSRTGDLLASRVLDTEGVEGEVIDMLADPSSRWLYMARGCHRPRIEVFDRFTPDLERVRRIDLPSEDREFSCDYGTLVLSRNGEDAIYLVVSDGGRDFSRERSHIVRVEIPAASDAR